MRHTCKARRAGGFGCPFRSARATAFVAFAAAGGVAQALVFVGPARAADDIAQWDGTVGNWSSAARWSHTNPAAAGQFPNNGNGGLTYDAIVNAGNATLDLDILIDHLSLGGGTISGPEDLALNVGLAWTSGALSGAGMTSVGSGGTITISGAPDKGLSRVVVGNGTTSWLGGRLNVSNGTFNNNGTFFAEADNSFENFGGTNGFNNNGAFVRSVGTGTANINIPFYNSGSVTVSSGTLSLNGGGPGDSSIGGSFMANAGATLRIGGGAADHTGSTFAGAGTMMFSGGETQLSAYAVSGTTVFNGGTAHFNGAASTGALSMSGGTIHGSGTLAVSGVGSWTAGLMAGAGTTSFSASSALTITGAADKGLSRQVASAGTTTWTQGRVNVSNGTFRNSGHFSAEADNSFENFGGTNAFENSGALTRTAGTGTANFGIPFSNSGSVTVTSGTLSLNAGGTSTGTFAANAGGTLRFAGGNHDASASSVGGNGTVMFSGGNTSLGAYNVTGMTVISGGTANFNHPAGVTVGLNLSGGALGGTGTLAVNGPGTWTAGSVIGGGTTRFTAPSTLSIGGPNDKGLSRVVRSEGLVTWSAGRMNVSNGTWINSGTFAAEADNAFENFGGTNLFGNAGQLVRTTGTGSANFSIPFANTGTVVVSSGTMSLNAGGTSTGAFVANGAGTLRFGGGNHDASGSGFSGTGTMMFSNGNATVGTYNMSGPTVINGGTATFATAGASGTSLAMTGGGLGGAGNVTFSGAGTWTAGAMFGTGTTTFGGPLTVEGASDKGLSRNVVTIGPATWTSGRLNVSSGTWINNGTFNVEADNSFENFGGSNAFNNNGDLVRSTGIGTVNFSVPFHNTSALARVVVNSGTVSLNAGGTSAGGTFTANGAGTLRFGGGTHDASAATVNGSGTAMFATGTVTLGAYSVATTVINGGTALFNAPLAGGPTLVLSNGALGGTGTAHFSGAASWTAGTMFGAGSTAFGTNAVVTISGGNDKGLSRHVHNTGTVTWSEGRLNVAGGTFFNAGTLFAEADNSFENFGGANAFVNNLRLLRTTGAGTANISIPFVNQSSGSVSVSSGTLSLNAGGNSAGSFTANGGGTLRFGGGVHELSASSSISGSGSVVFGGGTVNIGGSYAAANTRLTGGTAAFQPAGTGVMRTNALSFAGTSPNWQGRLDLTNDALVIDYSGASPFAVVQDQIRTAHGFGNWSGNGITTSQGNATTHGLGYAEASSLGSVPPLFGTVDGTAVLVRYTRYGDANLDGTVNLADFNRLAANFGTPSGATWLTGDFTYDMIVNLADFNRLAANFGLAASGPDVSPQDWSNLAAAVPEPASLAFNGVAAFAATFQRRRRDTARR